MSIIQILKDWDSQLLLYINHHNTVFWNHTMYIITSKETWFIFYGMLIYILFKYYGKRMLLIIPMIALTILFTDQICNLFKHGFERPRPGHDPIIGDMVNIFFKKGGKYGFISGHSGNSFALVALVFGYMKNKPLYVFMILWATIVAFSRVYLGVHYPGDILVGGIVGYIVGHLIYKLTCYLEPKFYKKETSVIATHKLSFSQIEPAFWTGVIMFVFLLLANYLYLRQNYID